MKKNKKGQWTVKEDIFLLQHQHILADGANYIAEHDLGRPYGSGAERLKALTLSGARAAFAKCEIERIRFHTLAGRGCFELDDQKKHWLEELALTEKLTEGKP